MAECRVSAGAHGAGGDMMSATTLSRADGEGRKAGAFALLAARRELLILRARRALLGVLLDNGLATIDDVRDRVPLPDGVNPKAFGPVPGELAAAGIIVADGFTKSRRAESHARPVQVWRLADRDAALAWLAAHPDRPDPVDDRAGGRERTLFD